jgi:hypothetical protein
MFHSATSPRLRPVTLLLFVRPRLVRRARNPVTSEVVKVSAKNVVTFKPGKAMGEKIQKRSQKKRPK